MVIGSKREEVESGDGDVRTPVFGFGDECGRPVWEEDVRVKSNRGEATYQQYVYGTRSLQSISVAAACEIKPNPRVSFLNLLVMSPRPSQVIISTSV